MGIRGSKPAVADNHGRVLPPDVLFDILLRLPAKDICRFRAVCRHCLSLTSDPLFVEAHAARHPPGPLIAVSFHGERDHVHLMDVSGRVVKRVPCSVEGRILVPPSCLDLVCVADWDDGRCSVINPATGAVSHLPNTPPEVVEEEDDDDDEEEDEEDYWDSSSDIEEWDWSMSGWGTPKYKVLRMSEIETEDDPRDPWLVCSVLTINNGAHRGRLRWIYTRSPPEAFPVAVDSAVVIGCAVYFFWSQGKYSRKLQKGCLKSYGPIPNCIACFDLETEGWSTIPGPRGRRSFTEFEDTRYPCMWSRSTLSELGGCLVLVQNGDRCRSFLDIWFLRDAENHVWVKEYSVWDIEEAAIPAWAGSESKTGGVVGQWEDCYLYWLQGSVARV